MPPDAEGAAPDAVAADLAAIADYFWGDPSAEQRAAVEKRLESDPEFLDLAAPQLEMWCPAPDPGPEEEPRPIVLVPPPPPPVVVRPVVHPPVVARPRRRRRLRIIYGLLPLAAGAAIVGWVYRDAGSEPLGVPVDPRAAALDSAAVRAAARNWDMEMARDPALALASTTRRVPAAVMPIGDVQGLFRDGYRAETARDRTMVVPLPGGSKLLLYPESFFLFNGDSARTMRGRLSGEAVLDVPAGTSWQVQTVSAAFTLKPGRYAIRSWREEAGTAISIERGGVYALTDSVVGTKIFALLKREPETIRQVEGQGFPIPIAPEDDR